MKMCDKLQVVAPTNCVGGISEGRPPSIRVFINDPRQTEVRRTSPPHFHRFRETPKRHHSFLESGFGSSRLRGRCSAFLRGQRPFVLEKRPRIVVDKQDPLGWEAVWVCGVPRGRGCRRCANVPPFLSLREPELDRMPGHNA